MEKNHYLFTSESVSAGHPDKVMDQIADNVLDNFLAFDKDSHCAIEGLCTTGQVVLAGEVKSEVYVDIPTVVRDTIKKIGYTKAEYQFDGDSCGVLSAIHEQSPDIDMGVSREDAGESGAGDQGIMFGYATNETENYMPITLKLSHMLVKELEIIRKKEIELMPYLRPDAKSQVTVEYDENDNAVRIDTIVVSTQHDEFDTDENMQNKIRQDVINIVVPRVVAKCPECIQNLFGSDINYHVNPTGKFVIGGPSGDSGLCLAEDTLVYTKRGLEAIQNLKIGQTVFTQNSTAKIIDKFSNGRKQTHIITDEHNMTIEATLNHPFRVWDGERFIWKECGDLKVGDWLVKRRFSRYKVRHDELNRTPKYPKSFKYYVGHKQEERECILNDDFAYLLGWLTRDGNICDDRLTFYYNYNSDEERNLLYDKVKKVFPDVKHYDSSDDRYVVLSMSLVEEMRKLGMMKETAKYKTIPEFVLRNSNQIKQAYLRGLFDADGYIQIGGGRNNDVTKIALTTVSDKLAQQVCNVLYSLGITSTIYKTITKAHTFVRENGKVESIPESKVNEVNIVGIMSKRKFARLIRFDLEHKKERLTESFNGSEYKDNRFYSVAILLQRLMNYDVDLKVRYNLNKHGDQQAITTNRVISVECLSYILDIYGRYCNTEEWKILKELVDCYDMVRIENIEESEANTWDITLDDDTHAFIANSFVVHNTGRKIIVDTYGGWGAHGGGAFSGKDPSKVDRSGAYAARYIAKNAVSAGLADRMLVQISYAIGVAKPTSFYVNTYGTNHTDMSDAEVAKILGEMFDLRPYAIIRDLKLKQPMYAETAAYGHFGRKNEIVHKHFENKYGEDVDIDVELFTWEKLDKVDEIKNKFSL